MTIKAFPNIEEADEDGVLAVGGDLKVESLLLAYRSGIFPWPFDEDNLVWFAPPKRALLFFDDLYINRSFRKVIKNKNTLSKKTLLLLKLSVPVPLFRAVTSLARGLQLRCKLPISSYMKQVMPIA